jgi:hypothetical protein
MVVIFAFFVFVLAVAAIKLLYVAFVQLKFLYKIRPILTVFYILTLASTWLLPSVLNVLCFILVLCIAVLNSFFIQKKMGEKPWK